MSGHRRRADAARAWTPVDELSELARALLSDDLGGRDAVPAHVADRVAALAVRWAEHGFTAGTVRPWADLAPACAAYLAGRGVPSQALEQVVEAGGSAGPLTLRTALSTGRFTAERAYEMLAAAGLAPSSTRTPPTPATDPPATDPPATGGTARTHVAPAPVVFSHADADHPGDSGRGRRRGAVGRASRTPFWR